MSNRNAYLLTPDILLRAYAAGIFPMAESAQSSELRWYDPPIRALIPLDERFHVSRSLVRTLRRRPYRLTLNHAFGSVIRACAASQPQRETTWINEEIIHLYTALHQRGHAHSIEVWSDDRLVGGLYGVSLGRGFFGESMFSLETNTSKIALVHLVALLRHCEYLLLDTQFQTPHLERFGTFEITRTAYHHLLAAATSKGALPFPQTLDWDYLLGIGVAGSAGGLLSLHPVTHIS